MYADVELQKDKDTISKAIDNEIKNKGYSPSYELAEHRKMIKLILDKLGITDEEFNDYFNKVESIKTEIKEQDKINSIIPTSTGDIIPKNIDNLEKE